MINRDDILELTRRMTPKRTSMDRIAGAYMDADGFIDGTFNIHFLKLKEAEKKKNLDIAKSVVFYGTNDKLVEYPFKKKISKTGTIYQLLHALKECALKNDALLEVLYEEIGKVYKSNGDYAIYLFHGVYDVPIKFKDKESYYDSEEVYEYLIMAICPLKGEYEPDEAEFGFLFPAFSDRSADLDSIDIYQGNAKNSGMLEFIGV